MATALLAVLPAAAVAAPSDAPSQARGTGSSSPRASAARTTARATKKKETPAQRRRRELLAQLRKKPSLILDSSFIHRAQAAGTVLPFTLRLRRPYEGGPGDDQVQLTWDASAVPWPLAGTVPPGAPSLTNLDGSTTYEWDYRADTSGYATLGTVETLIGGGVSLTASPFAIAAQDGAACTSVQAIEATGVTLASAGVRFGTANPYSGVASGTLNLRPSILTRVTPCGGGAPTSAVAVSTTGDPPLPVPFDGKLTVSPGLTSDGRIRFGILSIGDSAGPPQRSTFGLVNACTDPAAADCGRKAFPVRTKLMSLRAEILVGDAMPPAPDPLVAPAPAPPAPAPAPAP